MCITVTTPATKMPAGRTAYQVVEKSDHTPHRVACYVQAYGIERTPVKLLVTETAAVYNGKSLGTDYTEPPGFHVFTSRKDARAYKAQLHHRHGSGNRRFVVVKVLAWGPNGRGPICEGHSGHRLGLIVERYLNRVVLGEVR